LRLRCVRYLQMRISVVIPAFNAAAVLHRSVASVVAQGVAGTEIIVVDDASTDDTRQVAERLASQTANLRVLPRNLNEGPGRCRNLGARAARSPYVCFLDADDAYGAGVFTKALSILNTSPATHAVTFPIRLINSHRDVRAEHLKAIELSVASNVIVRADFLKRIGGFPEGPQFRTRYAGEDMAFRAAVKTWGNITEASGIFLEYTVRRGSHFDQAIDMLTGLIQPDDEANKVCAALEARAEWVLRRLVSQRQARVGRR
jgi:glycosyltransferase involved in cell wall biosynthesis